MKLSPRFLAAAWLLAVLTAAAPAAAARDFPLGDTLTVVQRPLLNIPSILCPGDSLEITAVAGPGTTGWEAGLSHGEKFIPLTIGSAQYSPALECWTLRAEIPEPEVYELYDLHVFAAGGVEDRCSNAVRVIEERRQDWYFVQFTDTHLPDHTFSSAGGEPSDSTEMEDLREVIEDINLINPEFVLLTGDVVNEGELEDYLDWRAYSRAQYLLTELEVPVYVTGGNHDLGGWSDTPPSDGTARRNWWRFFGWPQLDDPPAELPWRTQNYSFDYGPVHFTGLEAYDNYDGWRYETYGATSFTPGQMQWLYQDLAGSDAECKVLFYHYDFAEQLNLEGIGADMALWGHVHHDMGSIYGHPYDLSTDNVCDGERAYRVIRVSGATLAPQQTVRAGETGDAMRLLFNPSNDGTHDTVMALVSNDHAQRFEQGLAKFRMPKTSGTVSVEGPGSILQVDGSHPDYDVYYVGVDIQPVDWQTIILSVDSTGTPGQPPPGPLPRLVANHPNPFNPTTTLTFELARDAEMLLSVHDASGREVRRLYQGLQEVGRHQIDWDGRDDRGRPLPAGLYVARILAEGESDARKMIMLK